LKVAEFEEKQYEMPLVHELAAGSPHVYPAGQVLEELVGYDVALMPGDGAIWKLLDVGAPSGALLSPSLWMPFERRPREEELPALFVSLILQFKRPQYLDHWRAGQYEYWQGGYFRFRLDAEQQLRLQSLEVGVASDALVRYAAAAFVEYLALCRHTEAGTLAANSTFVSPGVLAGHRLWSYASPGAKGYANPEGEEVSSDTVETLLVAAAERTRRQTLREHVHALAASQPFVDVGDGEWLNELPQAGRRSEEDRRSAAEWAAVAAAAALCGASWFVLGFD
jgi:hypothetical protein